MAIASLSSDEILIPFFEVFQPLNSLNAWRQGRVQIGCALPQGILNSKNPFVQCDEGVEKMDALINQKLRGRQCE